MKPRSVASSLAGLLVKLGALLQLLLLLLTTAPSASAFNSYLAGLKYYQLGNCLTNAPAITDKPLDTAPESGRPWPGYLHGDSTSTKPSSNLLAPTTNDEYVRGGTLPMILGEALPDLVVNPAPASTILDDAADNEAAAATMDCTTTTDSSDSAVVASGPSTKPAYAVTGGSVSAKVDKSVKSYSPFGARCKASASASVVAPVPSTNAAAGGGSYLDRLRLVQDGMESSSEPLEATDSTSFTGSLTVDESQPTAVAGSTSTAAAPEKGPASLPRKAASYLGFGSRPKMVVRSAAPTVSAGYLDGIANGGLLENRSTRVDYEAKPAQPAGDPPSAALGAYDAEMEAKSSKDDATGASDKMVTLNQYSMPSYTTVTGIPEVDGDEPGLRVDACTDDSTNVAGAALSNADFAPPPSATTSLSSVRHEIQSKSPVKAPKFTVFGRKPVAVPESFNAWVNAGPVRQDAGAKVSTNPLGAVPDPSTSASEVPDSAVGHAVKSSVPPKESKFTVFGRKPHEVPESANAWMNAALPVRQDAGVETTTDQPAAVPDSSSSALNAASDLVVRHDATSTSPARKSKFTVFGRKPRVVSESFHTWANAGPVRHDAGAEASTTQLGAVPDPSVIVKDISGSVGRHEVKSNAPLKQPKFAVFGRKPMAVPESSNAWMNAGPVRPSGVLDAQSTPATSGEATASIGERETAKSEAHQVAAAITSVAPTKKPSYSGFGVKPKASDSPNALSAGYLRGLALSSTESDAAASWLSERETTPSPVSERAESTDDTSHPDVLGPANSAPTAFKKPSFSGFGVKHAAKTSTQRLEPTSDSSILSSHSGTEYLKSIATTSSATTTPKGSFTGFGAKPTARHSGDGYLHGLASSSASTMSFTAAPVAAESAVHPEPETKPAEPYVPPLTYVNVAQSILPVKSAESTWVSGKSLQESSGATTPIGGVSTSSSALAARAPPAPDAKPLPLINSYSPTQWTLNRQQQQQSNAAAAADSKSPSGSANKIFTGATIESIDSSLKAVDFAPLPIEPPLVAATISDTAAASVEIDPLLPLGADSSDGEEAPSNLDSDASTSPTAAALPSAPVEIRQSVFGASYLASLTTAAATSTAAPEVSKRKAASYLGFGAASWRPTRPNSDADDSLAP